MRLFRFGPPGRERAGAIDANGIRRDISSFVDDLSGSGLSPDTLATLRSMTLKSLPNVSNRERLGPCIGGTRNFVAVGLNYKDHAAESGAAVPTEPVLFNKAPSCIVGPGDDIKLPVGSRKTDWEVELALVIGSDTWCVSEKEAPCSIAGFVSAMTFQNDIFRQRAAEDSG
jgi:2,4-didehydro-3-deoxy-L-rhamnonate hydrolase